MNKKYLTLSVFPASNEITVTLGLFSTSDFLLFFLIPGQHGDGTLLQVRLWGERFYGQCVLVPEPGQWSYV